MSISVQTNMAALTVLQNLNRQSAEAGGVPGQTSGAATTNGGARDSAILSAAGRAARGDVTALGAAKMSLDRANSIAELSLSAGEAVADVLGQMQDLATTAADPATDDAARAGLNSQFQALLGQISDITQSASFDGANLLDGSGSDSLQFQANAQSGSTITLSPQDMSLGGPIVTVSAAASLASADGANQALSAVDASIANVDQALSALGAQAKQITSHSDFVQRLAETLQSGVGEVDGGDLASEGASLHALQVQQLLGAQSLSIANQAPQMILSLFKAG
jgi:flagellin